ncbi:MAG: hypothetical protein JF615_14945, partial [Asticcacaulis sp.]|nr:hypothetical protein [Asticcacaulis sp.]
MSIIFAGFLFVALVGWGKAVWDLVTGGPTYIGTRGETPIYDRGYLMLQLVPATGVVGFVAVLALSEYFHPATILAIPFWVSPPWVAGCCPCSVSTRLSGALSLRPTMP